LVAHPRPHLMLAPPRSPALLSLRSGTPWGGGQEMGQGQGWRSRDGSGAGGGLRGVAVVVGSAVHSRLRRKSPLRMPSASSSGFTKLDVACRMGWTRVACPMQNGHWASRLTGWGAGRQLHGAAHALPVVSGGGQPLH
jgi:hypothetical protein